MKNTKKKFDVRKYRMTAIKIAIAFCTLCMACSTSLVAFAEGEGGGGSYATGESKALFALAFWILRVIIFFAGGAIGMMKLVNGKADENPRDTNAGIGLLIVTGAAIAGTFIVENYVI